MSFILDALKKLEQNTKSSRPQKRLYISNRSGQGVSFVKNRFVRFFLSCGLVSIVAVSLIRFLSLEKNSNLSFQADSKLVVANSRADLIDFDPSKRLLIANKSKLVSQTKQFKELPTETGTPDEHLTDIENDDEQGREDNFERSAELTDSPTNEENQDKDEGDVLDIRRALPVRSKESLNLVLQGTSAIEGRAVAVISEQRVFEGDRIDGALVLRIMEREVELEYKGELFRLQL